MSPGISPGLRLFIKAHAAAGVGTLADIALFQILVVAVAVAPVPAVATSATIGAGINFLLARNWVFAAGRRTVAQQALLFAVGALASICLNALLVYCGVAILGWNPLLVRILAVGVVAAGFNFPFQRWCVFAEANPGKRE